MSVLTIKQWPDRHKPRGGPSTCGFMPGVLLVAATTIRKHTHTHKGIAQYPQCTQRDPKGGRTPITIDCRINMRM